MSILLLLFFLLIFVSVLILTDQVSYLHWLTGKKKKETSDSTLEKDLTILGNSRLYAYAILIITFLGLVYLIYQQLVGTPYEGHLKEWMNLIVRWVHITFGIAWIGTSFYFVFLENALNRTKGLRKGIAGNLWSVHGGGFYYIEKYKVAPDEIPEELHWFKYEAYFTWLSGFLLLCVVYYLNANAYLIDPEVLDISPSTGIALGLGALLTSWLVYDGLCKSPLSRNVMLFAIVGFALMTLMAWGLCQVFSSRAAYIHMGAIIGTLMAGNVFFVIIPGQKAMVAAAKAGKTVDPTHGKNAGWRSLHNNYFTLPVLFIMISNHFPSTFGYPYPWAVLAAISFASAIFKHFLNLIERGQYAAWFFPVSALMMLSIAYVTAPKLSTEACDKTVSFTQIYSIVNERCISCHSAQPTDDVWTSPPNGVVYDTPNDIVKMKDKIMQRVVITKNMPQNNKTGITPEERDLIRCWINQGAKVD